MAYVLAGLFYVLILYQDGTVDQLYESIENKTNVVQTKMQLLHPKQDLEHGQRLSDDENNSIVCLVIQSPGEKKSDESKTTIAQECPDCQSLVERLATEKSLLCPVCSEEKQREVRFCSSCLSVWPSSENAETCGNEDCTGQSHMDSDQDPYLLLPNFVSIIEVCLLGEG